MPTSITVPIAQRTKSIQFGAAYSAATTFNPDKKLLVGCSGVLSGMGLTIDTLPNPDQVTVDPGAFIQNGIIVNITSAQVVEMPAGPSFPIYLVAENANETFNSSVQILFTTAPSPSSAIIAEWPDAPSYPSSPTIPVSLSNCELRDELELINKFVIQRDRQIAGGGQTVFNLTAPKSYVTGSNKLWVFRNGKKLDVSNDYSESSTTQVTLNFGATAGDIMEFMIVKSEPPITSIALDDLTDVITDLSNAIKDVGVLRVAPATAANPLATMADIAAAAPSPGPFSFSKLGAETVSTGVAGGVTVAAAQVTFTLTATRDVKVEVTSGGFYHSINGSSGTAYIRIDSNPVTDKQIGYVYGSDGGDTLVETGQCAGWAVYNLPAGVHTADLYGTGGGNPSILGPIRIMVSTSEPI